MMIQRGSDLGHMIARSLLPDRVIGCKIPNKTVLSVMYLLVPITVFLSPLEGWSWEQ